ncbi:type II secretion system F family protein [Actinomadura rupiterrae]|uniref:type II secretion system F family protein n=1 Tax=Actinomadura rupiterrae TaxID=559627 RepID=UPI0020A2835B|nr:type II secretion system F family protein [Actinomadura rupiterrae]MCP2338911.1 Flp pilus assembly protein TadB [Actinomadura rupiterrae]
MTTALLLGLGCGLGLLALWRGLRPPRTALAAQLARLTPTAPPLPAPPPADADGSWTARLGRPLAPVLAELGLPTRSMRADLAVLGRAPERLLAEKAATPLIGALLPPALWFLLTAGGLAVAWTMPLWASLALAAAGFIVPDLALRNQANQRRAAFRQALAAFLDLVVIGLAGGAGVEAALTHAATAGTGWSFEQLRRALDTAQLTRRPPWTSLADLGRRLQIPELVELAATVTLAGTEGAKIRTSLTAKAAAVRAHQLADAEADAQAATERLSLPLVLLFGGFLLLLGYPAVVHVLTAF